MATEAETRTDIETSQANQEGTVTPPKPALRRLVRWRQAFTDPRPSAIANAPDSDPVELTIAVLSDTGLQLLDIARRILFRRDQ